MSKVTERLARQQSNGEGICPRADVIRHLVRQAGLEHHIERIASGRRYTYVRLDWRNGLDGEENGERLAAVLRPQWDDGARRVYVVPVTGTVVIDRGRFWEHPAATTQEG